MEFFTNLNLFIEEYSLGVIFASVDCLYRYYILGYEILELIPFL